MNPTSMARDTSSPLSFRQQIIFSKSRPARFDHNAAVLNDAASRLRKAT